MIALDLYANRGHVHTPIQSRIERDEVEIMDEDDIYIHIYTKRREREGEKGSHWPDVLAKFHAERAVFMMTSVLSPSCEGVSTGTAIKLYQIRD